MASVQPSPPLHVIRRSACFDALVLQEIVYPAKYRIEWHSHPLAAFALTLRGSSMEAFTNTRFDGTERGIILRPAGERHWDLYGDQGAKCFLIELSGQWFDGLPRLRLVLDRPSFHRPGPLTLLARRVYREWLQNDSASQIAIPALGLEMAACLVRESESRSNAPPPLWLQRVRQRLDDGFAETPSLAELAGTGGVHPTHLARHFRRYYGVSVGEYLRKRRIDVAMDLLQKRDRPLTEIALATGFAHHAHFATAFKRLTGFTPSDFRRLRHPL